MSLEQTIRHTVIAESQDLDGRLQQLVRAGLMPANTIPILRKAISKVQGGMTLQGAERDVMANFINSMMFIVLGDDAIFNRARAGAKTYATEAKEKTEYDYEGDMAMGQLKSIIANSQRMHDMLSDDTNLPEWVQSKITLAEDYISTASNYMQGEMNEETIEEKRGLWDNIHAKRKRIKGGSGERMRKPGSEGAPTAAALKASQTEEVDLDESRRNRMRDIAMDINSLSHEDFKKKHRKTKQEMQDSLKSESVALDELSTKTLRSYRAKAKDDAYDAADVDDDRRLRKRSMGSWDAGKKILKRGDALRKEEVEQVDEISKGTMGRYINKAKDSIDMTSYRSGVKDAAGDEYKPKNPLERKLTKRHKGISMAVKKLTKEDIDAAKSMNESYKTKFDAALEHYNIKSPSELGEEQRKEFFNHVDQEFKKGDK